MPNSHEAVHQLILDKVSDLHKDVIEIKNAVKKQNGRVRRLEDWRNYVLGASAVLAIVGSILWKLL